MTAGEVVFSIANGFDADIWDDTLLIRQYERACQSSRRELKRRRAEAGKRKRNWELGNGCRVVYENDGLEYEATIVRISGRKATVRLHGYKEELEVPLLELTDSLGQQYIQEQIVEAQMEVVSEDTYTGSIKPGAHCRAFWSLDDAVYEATILSTVDDDKVTVRFIGYDNEDTVYIEDLLESKGQEWRDLQIEDAKLDYEEKNNNFNVDLDKLIQDNSDILTKPSEIPNINNLSLEENSHTSKSKKKEKKKDKSDEKKHKSDKKEKHREKKSSGSQNHSSLHPDIEKLISQGTMPGAMPALPGSLTGGLPGSLPGGLPGSLPGGLPGLLPSGVPSLGLPEIPSFLGMPSPLPDLNSYGLPGQAGLMPPFLGSIPGASLPGLMGASMLTPPPPPSNDVIQSSNQKMLHSMLTSWYLAGYHTGLYLGSASQQQTPSKEHKKKKSKK